MERKPSPALYETLNARTASLRARLNDWFGQARAPLKIEACGSLFKVAYTREVPFGELLYTLLRLRGIHIWDARPCFLTTAHTEEAIDGIMLCFQEAVRELQQAGFYSPAATAVSVASAGSLGQRYPAARLGKDPSGRFQPGSFLTQPGPVNTSR